MHQMIADVVPRPHPEHGHYFFPVLQSVQARRAADGSVAKGKRGGYSEGVRSSYAGQRYVEKEKD